MQYIIISFILGIITVAIPLGIKLRQHNILNEEIANENSKRRNDCEVLKSQMSSLESEFQKRQEIYKEMVANAEASAAAVKKSSMDAAIAELESSLKEVSEKYQAEEKSYEKEYLSIIADFSKEIEKKSQDIILLEKEKEKLSSLIASSVKARLREKEIKENLDFYKVNIDQVDLSDIITLRKIKSRLNKPRILSMLIWQTYYQKPLNQICLNVVGPNPVCGIYKITNIETNEVYIGQAVSIQDRWKTHAKCGLDIDRPPGNKLYQAMVEDGLENFTWEVLEACSANELNEKEKKYIELYQSFEYGYNSNKGVSK